MNALWGAEIEPLKTPRLRRQAFEMAIIKWIGGGFANQRPGLVQLLINVPARRHLHRCEGGFRGHGLPSPIDQRRSACPRPSAAAERTVEAGGAADALDRDLRAFVSDDLASGHLEARPRGP